MYIKHGNLSILKSELVDKTFDEVSAKHQNVRTDVLKGAWDKANPKGVKATKKVDEAKESKESKKEEK